MSKPKSNIAGIAEGRSDVFKIDPRKLNIKAGWNSRDFNSPDNQAHVIDLANSIAAKGVLEPLTIYWDDGKAWVNNGECRLRATIYAIDTLKADIKSIPCRTEEQFANDTDRLLNQYIRNTGKPFSPLELSSHFKRLLGAGYEPKDISAKTGLSQGRVSQILNLQTLPEGIKREVVAGNISATLAAQVTKELGPTEAEKQLKAGIEAAKTEGVTKVTPRHINGIQSNIQTVVFDAFDHSEVDTDQEGEFVVITMPRDKWNEIKDRLKL